MNQAHRSHSASAAPSNSQRQPFNFNQHKHQNGGRKYLIKEMVMILIPDSKCLPKTQDVAVQGSTSSSDPIYIIPYQNGVTQFYILRER